MNATTTTTWDEPVQIQIRAALDALTPAALELRRRGWDVTAWVEYHGDHYTAELRIRIPALGKPIEAAE